MSKATYDWGKFTVQEGIDIGLYVQWTAEGLEKMRNLKRQVLGYPFDVFELEPMFDLCLSFSTTAFREWEDIENALRSRNGNVRGDLVKMAAVTDAFATELLKLYDPRAKYSRRRILQYVQMVALVVLFAVFMVVAFERFRGWTGFGCLLLLFDEGFLNICAPFAVVASVNEAVEELLQFVHGVKATYLTLKKAVDTRDTGAIDRILKNKGHRQLMRMSVKYESKEDVPIIISPVFAMDAMESDADKKLYENMVSNGTFVVATAELVGKMTNLMLCSRVEMNLVGALETSDVLKDIHRAFVRSVYIERAIKASTNVHHDLREMADEMVHFSHKLNDIHESHSNIRQVRRWLRFHVPFISLFTGFAFCLAVVLGFVDFSWEARWTYLCLVICVWLYLLLFMFVLDASGTSDFEATLPLIVEALKGLGQTYRRLGVATNVRTRDPVAIDKIIHEASEAAHRRLRILNR
ncbi:hypothetical protein FB45DRAFT_949397 [Roridomyces roridus]|uniref:Uncharacterized protein n=1 Tax=Roridomyces roridus TaxID=1738132 RepID=A0AAD7B1S1_9AGAR|nr:hypothetical protein FB45DRAFT_949397 [Roridomyces roridus]